MKPKYQQLNILFGHKMRLISVQRSSFFLNWNIKQLVRVAASNFRNRFQRRWVWYIDKMMQITKLTVSWWTSWECWHSTIAYLTVIWNERQQNYWCYRDSVASSVNGLLFISHCSKMSYLTMETPPPPHTQTLVRQLTSSFVICIISFTICTKIIDDEIRFKNVTLPPGNT